MRIRIKRSERSNRIRKKALKWIGIVVLAVIIFVAVDVIFFTKEYEPSTVYLESPEWMDHYIDTSSEIRDQGSGPEIWASEDKYEVIKLSFYDEKETLIRDQIVVDEILEMLIFTEDDFIYSKERSGNGVSFFYYNGILKAGQRASLIAGFKGKDTFPQNGNSQSIEKIRIRIESTSISTDGPQSLEEALLEVR